MTTTIRSPEPSGQQLRDQGVSDVLAADAAVHRGHRSAIETALNELIASGSSFSADDVHTLLPDDVQPHSANLIPAMIATYSCAGRIRAIGWVASTRPSRHAAVIRQWIGTPAEEAA